MKNFLVIIISLFTTTAIMAQESAQEVSGPVMTFEKEQHDFGEIYQGDKVEHVFEFENTGNEPLIISNVQTTCGCTAPEWPRDPVAPGQTGKIKVVFNSAGKIGRQHKVITIVSNATNPRNRVIITTNVLPKKDDGQ
ncbi:MAG: DUF1573 domain-containing protein [Fulvivirga sp.]|nr:DUF1573 domain-containing protein [Fulvivirga sp.]